MPVVEELSGSGSDFFEEKYIVTLTTTPVPRNYRNPIVGWVFLGIGCLVLLVCFIGCFYHQIESTCNCCSRSFRFIFQRISVCFDSTYRNLLYVCCCCKEPSHAKISANFIVPISVSKYKSSEISECNICLSDLNNTKVVTLECGHKFHKNCIIKWFTTQIETGNHPSCPSCRNLVKQSGTFKKQYQPSPVYDYSSGSDFDDYFS